MHYGMISLLGLLACQAKSRHRNIFVNLDELEIELIIQSVLDISLLRNQEAKTVSPWLHYTVEGGWIVLGL